MYIVKYKKETTFLPNINLSFLFTNAIFVMLESYLTNSIYVLVLTS